jgi:two-component system LytT family response regulator
VKKIRALIVDDEPLARERLRAMMRAEDSVEIVGECGSGPEAIQMIRNTPLDLVFLDMEMPGCDGLQVIAGIPVEARPAIVFATAYEGFAIEAFEVNAIDYLLKPFDRERFQKTLQRVREHLTARQAGEQLAKLMAEPPATADKKPERLAVKADGRVIFVKPDEIVWIEAADNYVVLHLATGRLMLRETMSALEARLGAVAFARVNRSAIVHLDQVKEMHPTAHGDYVLLLRDGTRLPLSRSLRGRLGRFASGSA